MHRYVCSFEGVYYSLSSGAKGVLIRDYQGGFTGKEAGEQRASFLQYPNAELDIFSVASSF